MSKAYIAKRLSWYYPVELFNAVMFTGITIFVAIHFGLKNSLALTYGLALMTFILFQGQHYWKLKLYRLTNKPFDDEKNLTLFKKSQQLNLLLISFIPVIFMIDQSISNEDSKAQDLFIWALLANSFAVLEHINYYYWQLMVDNIPDIKYIARNRKLKTSSLRKDLREQSI